MSLMVGASKNFKHIDTIAKQPIEEDKRPVTSHSLLNKARMKGVNIRSGWHLQHLRQK